MKNPNTTISSKEDNKKETTLKGGWDDYFCLYSFKMKPVNIAWIEKLSKELVKWSLDENSLKLSQFYLENSIPKRDFYRWKEKHAFLQAAFDHAKENIGNRREIGGLKRVYESSIVKSSMKFYDEQWKESDDQDKEHSAKFIAVLEKFPSSDSVPEKIKKD